MDIIETIHRAFGSARKAKQKVVLLKVSPEVHTALEHYFFADDEDSLLADYGDQKLEDILDINVEIVPHWGDGVFAIESEPIPDHSGMK